MARPDTGQVVAWYICTAAACVFLVCRLIVRWRLLKKLYLDDIFVIGATLCLIGDLAIQHYMFTQGMSAMAKATTAEEINMMKMIIPGSTLYVTSLWLIKSSLVIFYKRLADRTRYETVYNITLAVLGATWLVLFFDIVFKCFPPDRQWKSIENPDLACPSGPSTINYWLTILFNIFSDAFIICLPISQVARLKMPPKQKLGVISVFLLGVLVIITSIVRAIYSYRNEQMITCTVSMIETAIAIIASCLPVLRTLVFGSHSRKGTYSGRRGYELSTSGPTGLGTGKQRTTVSVSHPDTHAGELSRHDSEDELVKANGLFSLDDAAGISVTREYFVHEAGMDGQSLR
ncbi:hypothetical protein BO70DRAFT_390300 [Aspergillus heteromorphus CBS 117.55]|uniref:Rhodopsin domain-containing protein n=1 Tax=Aspergillus heteromorphus CBS 117.55 TaxID=1448321 RepID=A0A317V2Y0_9EURO|nr:uncharacterized protein BO70DRAFT_390300 [Aspergillus heteromorphus CBS 117.55]PWY68386.1 hypothetical protein BO70DRAFT_390300 [Aspergillus heteromorphus CBS 117.55]